MFATFAGWSKRSGKENNRIIGAAVFFIIVGVFLLKNSGDEGGGGYVVSDGSGSKQTDSAAVTTNTAAPTKDTQPKFSPTNPVPDNYLKDYLVYMNNTYKKVTTKLSTGKKSVLWSGRSSKMSWVMKVRKSMMRLDT